jgi:hypothetical protein
LKALNLSDEIIGEGLLKELDNSVLTRHYGSGYKMVADSCGQGSELQGDFTERIYYLSKD